VIKLLKIFKIIPKKNKRASSNFVSKVLKIGKTETKSFQLFLKYNVIVKLCQT